MPYETSNKIYGVLAAIFGFAALMSSAFIPQDSRSQNAAVPDEDSGVRVVQGSLSNLDPEKQLLWIRMKDGRELQFTYNEDTTVEGEDRSVEALTGSAGDKELKIYYRVMAGINTAVRIEVLPVTAWNLSSP